MSDPNFGAIKALLKDLQILMEMDAEPSAALKLAEMTWGMEENHPLRPLIKSFLIKVHKRNANRAKGSESTKTPE